MTLDYQKVWNTMNELEMVTSKICSAREIIDAAIDRIQEHQYDKAETMMSAAHEFLGPECKGAWNDFWEEPKDKVTKWVLPIEIDGPSAEYYITLPDDLQDAANIHEGDTIEWIDLNNGSFEMRKVNGTV